LQKHRLIMWTVSLQALAEKPPAEPPLSPGLLEAADLLL
jgi:hypothetical protein